jgi:hypothetical protein
MEDVLEIAPGLVEVRAILDGQQLYAQVSHDVRLHPPAETGAQRGRRYRTTQSLPARYPGSLRAMDP